MPDFPPPSPQSWDYRPVTPCPVDSGIEPRAPRVHGKNSIRWATLLVSSPNFNSYLIRLKLISQPLSFYVFWDRFSIARISVGHLFLYIEFSISVRGTQEEGWLSLWLSPLALYPLPPSLSYLHFKTWLLSFLNMTMRLSVVSCFSLEVCYLSSCSTISSLSFESEFYLGLGQSLLSLVSSVAR